MGVLLMVGVLLYLFCVAFGVSDLLLLESSIGVAGTTFLGGFLLGCRECSVSSFVVRGTTFRGAVVVIIVRTSC